MKTPRILVAGIGNIFLGDDAFGVEVASRLQSRDLGQSVRVVDFGIRGLDLAYALMDGYDTAILVDALARGGEPGSLYLMAPDETATAQAAPMDAHGMDPFRVLQTVRAMGGETGRILVVGCEPATFGPEEGMMGLSQPVQAAVDRAVDWIESLVAEALETAAANNNAQEREAIWEWNS